MSHFIESNSDHASHVSSVASALQRIDSMPKLSGHMLGKRQYSCSSLGGFADERRQSAGSPCREMCQYANVDRCGV
jgi:hypothetical protein